MQSDGLTALTKQLGGTPPAGVGKLTDGDLTRLADTVRTARRTQAQELEKAALQALDHLPRLLRGPVRKVVGL